MSNTSKVSDGNMLPSAVRSGGGHGTSVGGRR